MIPNSMSKLKSRAFVYPGFTFIVLVGMYFYVNTLTVNLRHVQEAGEKCLTELTNTKYQLEVVMEYKNRLDSLLLENQKKFETEKNKFQEIIDQCDVIKQQTSICQGQFEDLQLECKKIQDENDELHKKLENHIPAG